MTTNAPDRSTALRQIAARASTIWERLAEPWVPTAPADPALVQARLDAWARSLSAGGQPETLRRFLAWEGLDEADGAAAARAVGPVQLPAEAPLPPWVETLGEVLAQAQSDFQDRAGLLRPDKRLPFEDLHIPFVHVFQQRLVAPAMASELLTTEAQTALERGLLARLVDAASQTLYAEFQVARTKGMGPLASFLPPGSDTLYRDFARRMQAGGLVTLFQKYPVLARKLATLTHLWTEAHVEFLQRLAADWPAIADTFGDGAVLGLVADLAPGLSDPHRGGRGVVALTFGSGRRLVYKPKDLGTEAAYNHLLAWLNERGAPLDMKVLRVLNRGTYGWVEFAVPAPCADEAAVARYYQRAGALLCLMYVLEGTDCHEENLVACGEYPVLIDNETLLHHRVRLVEKLADVRDTAQFQAYEQLDHSVLRTGLLPSWELRQDGQIAYDVSGLGGYGNQLIPYRVAQWTHVNTDHMKLVFKPARIPTRSNIPRLGDTPVRLDEHAEAVRAGFEAMYEFLRAHRPALLAQDGPLEAFRGQTVRFVFRPTRIYELILYQASQPRHLRDGADYGIALETLARAHLRGEGDVKPSTWPILRAERHAIQQLDIPLFTGRVDDDALILEGQGEVPAYFVGPSFDRVVGRVKGLDQADMARQSGLIQVALHARIADEGHKSLPETRAEATSHQDAAPLATEALVAQAVALAKELDARAIRGTDGSATWIAPLYVPQAERFQLGHLGLHLYDGLTGIALFLAALESVGASAGAGHRELCLAALQPARNELRRAESGQRILEWLGIGGAAGLGSVLYALVRLSQFLDEPALLDEAVAAAHLLTPDHIADDKVLDIIGGAAGAILGLLTVYEATQESFALERAVDCGRHLLTARVASARGPRAWATMGEALLTGFAHGAAGIAYALLRLAAHQVPGQAEFRAAAEEAIAYEASVFVESEGNWPDLRPSEAEPGVQRFQLAWCHGAPGIGLARLGGLPMLDTPAVRRDIEVALATTQRALAHQQHDSDHVCCGNMGRVDVLYEAGARLARPELTAEAGRHAAQVVARAEQSEGYRFAAMLPRGVFSPGFFQGAAGIGYELLRLAYPGQLPCVLLWE
ncbi:MAG: type 2 lantipeptide synthetase LanM family protein [Chloroflexi bacterium]|nr:type 2 lantipeptide synthetase LanM family protein [Chloroflexota bacterium]MBU1751560.1 type 2 lantipeptide synthetase LanM family protein [Chloroflexota bacterium]